MYFIKKVKSLYPDLFVELLSLPSFVNFVVEKVFETKVLYWSSSIRRVD